MTEIQIRKLIENGENSCVEFKRCGNGIESDVYETVCSFSNRFGGHILCGVLDDGTINGVPEKAAVEMTKNFISVISNPSLFSPTIFLEPEIVKIEGKTLIIIHVLNSPEVHTYKKIIYDRSFDSDVKITSTSKIAEMYIRKQNIFTEQKVFKYVTENELRSDLIELCRKRAINKRNDHPWKNLSNIELLKSSQLYTTDWNTGETGINLAGILLLGKDEVINSVCPAYKTDAILRKVNIDRYDDREIIKTNLIESYDLLMQFAHKHLLDKFFMEGSQTVSLRDKIVREMISNTLMHREFTSSFSSKFVIEKEKMFIENPCKALRCEELTPENFSPNSKNPIIASFFTNIGNADELGSGTRNLFKYSKLYSNQNPQMIEDDIFKIIVPLDDNYSADFSVSPKNTIAPSRTKFSENQSKVLELLKEDNSLSALKIAEKTHLSPRTVESVIKQLKEMNIITRQGSNKTGSWKILQLPLSSS